MGRLRGLIKVERQISCCMTCSLDDLGVWNNTFNRDLKITAVII